MNYSIINLGKFSADEQDSSKLDLSDQELIDQDIPILIEYALENSKVNKMKEFY